ncbi:hypothetical protein H1V43_25520 [Streptomyces sp. PSKA54]|uniref:Uncharacterized protein n=1 Tax=Streptomyces himalayensis subsp. aureolus TaxID=2758039 RepID=A0A7W2D556_9ACTN|nr:hypothetical protein [Streptomyces himalayensis]MBA4864655.1 hypothetical protein [Streptomyces himalayensis subsp. aureolus]
MGKPAAPRRLSALQVIQSAASCVAVHGNETPGLAALRDGHDRIDVQYEKRADGATLTYATRDTALVDALHDWFEAQLGDHGAHAEPGH